MTPRKQSRVSIHPTTPSDLPHLAAAECLSCSGLDFRLPAIIFPFRPFLAQTGAHPSYWPDYTWTIRYRTKEFLGDAVMFTAYLDETDSESQPDHTESSELGSESKEKRGTPVGYVKLSMPTSMLAEMKTKRGTSAAIVEKVKEVTDSLSKRLWGDDVIGMNHSAMEKWRAVQAELVQRHPYADEYYCLQMMVVHPHYQKRGVGSALMARVLQLADLTNTPIFIRDATPAGMPLYTSNGFTQVDTLRFEYKGEVAEMYTLVRGARKNDREANER